MNIARYWLWLLVTVALLASSGLAERLPLQKKAVNFDLKIPEHYEKWEGPPDPRTGISRKHDPQPRVVPLGKNPGRYAFEWIALDGTKKRAIYERPDGTDAIVAARVSELSGRLPIHLSDRSSSLQRRAPGSLHGSMFLRPGHGDRAKGYICGKDVERDPAVQRGHLEKFWNSRKISR